MTSSHSSPKFGGQTVLITGASMGLGAEFARQYAAAGANVLLVARSADKLDQVASQCKSLGIQAECLTADLTRADDRSRVVEWAKGLPEHLRPNILVNNAGFGDAGLFSSMALERVHDMVSLNVLALTDLTSRLLPVIQSAPRGTGRILLVSSVAGYQPLPYFGVYAATKAYVTHFGEALHEELADQGIGVTVLCPGVTKTEFGNNGQGLASELFARGATAEYVVRKAIAATHAKRALCNTADSVRIALSRLVPRWIVRKIAAAIARGILAKS